MFSAHAEDLIFSASLRATVDVPPFLFRVCLYCVPLLGLVGFLFHDNRRSDLDREDHPSTLTIYRRQRSFHNFHLRNKRDRPILQVNGTRGGLHVHKDRRFGFRFLDRALFSFPYSLSKGRRSLTLPL